jgi:hypothetical protein
MSHSSWTTQDELTFIDALGTHVEVDRRGPRESAPALARLVELLQGYLEGCQLRQRWEGMSSDVVIRHAEERLAAVREALRQERASQAG